MASNTDDAEVFVYTGEGGAEVPDDVVRVRVDPSVTSIPANSFYQCKKLAEVELCEASWKLGNGPSVVAATQLRSSTSPTHSGGLTVMPSHILSELLFVSTMTLKALETGHS
jgi:hypothetical protein